MDCVTSGLVICWETCSDGSTKPWRSCAAPALHLSPLPRSWLKCSGSLMTLAEVIGVTVLISVMAEPWWVQEVIVCNETLVSTASAGTGPSGKSSLSLKDFSPSELVSWKKFWKVTWHHPVMLCSQIQSSILYFHSAHNPKRCEEQCLCY